MLSVPFRRIHPGRAKAESAMMTRPPVSAEAFGVLRMLWKQLEADAARITKAVEAVPPAMAAAAVRKGIGSRAAIDRVCGRLPIPLMARTRRRAVWRFLAPIDRAEPPALAVKGILLGAANRPPLTIEDFGLMITRHSLGRLYDQAGAGADLPAAIIEAHNHLAVLPPSEGGKVFALNEITLPAGPGVFLVRPRGHGDDAPMMIAKTWISNDQLGQAQSRDVATWAEFVAASVVSCNA
jgi:hypothetical protein